MKKNIFLIICIAMICNSCVWKENYFNDAEYDMQMAWENNVNAIFDNYITKAFLFNGWYCGNDTVRQLIMNNYLPSMNVAEVEPNVYTFCNDPNLPSDWFYRFETNGAPLTEIGSSWTISSQNNQYQTILREDCMYDQPYTTLLSDNRNITITCIDNNKWEISFETTENPDNKLQWTLELPNNNIPIDIHNCSMILSGSSCFELPQTNHTNVYLYANILEPIEASCLFSPKYGKVKLWAERDGQKSVADFVLNYHDGSREIVSE